MDRTAEWVALYSMVLEKIAEHLADPAANLKRLGIDPNDKKNEGLVQFGPLDMEQYHDLMQSWKRVQTSIRLYGLKLDESIELAPVPQVMASKTWQQNPWLMVGKEADLGPPLRFSGRDALTALGFMNFFIQQNQSVDPQDHVRKVLESQGITAENFHLYADRLAIKNPFTPE